MKFNRRTLLKGAAASAASMALATPAIFVPKPASANPWIAKNGKIKVGVLFSQSGDLAVIENDSTMAVRYALDEINANGGVAGMEVEPVVVDAMSDIQVYSERANQLILSDRVVSIFGCYTSASRRAIAPIIMARNHLLYYPTCYEGRECTQNIICNGPLANQHSKDLIPYMVKNFGPRVYFIGSNYIWPQESNQVARVWLDQVGGEVVGEDYIPLGGSEFSTNFNRIRQEKPDWIFSTLVGDSDVAMGRAYRQEGFDPEKMPVAALTRGEIEVRAMGADAGAGHFLSAPYFQVLDNPTNQRFVEGFLSSSYGGGGVTHYNMQDTYASVYYWKAGVERALAETGDIEEITPRMIRDVSGGIVLDDDISPEGRTWLDEQHMHAWKQPKIGRCRSDGQFEIVLQAGDHVEPDPFAIYPERGVCKIDGLHAPDGTVTPNVL